MKREYAFAYNINGTKLSGIITMTNSPTLVCYCDEENSKLILDALNTPLPPAEGAEEILRKPKYNSLKNLTLICEAMEEFATLHAQRIAEKMVEEKLREELVTYRNWIFDDDEFTERSVNEYLKSR